MGRFSPGRGLNSHSLALEPYLYEIIKKIVSKPVEVWRVAAPTIKATRLPLFIKKTQIFSPSFYPIWTFPLFKPKGNGAERIHVPPKPERTRIGMVGSLIASARALTFPGGIPLDVAATI
ncbi:MAG: hypothetical protein CM15mP49_07520 [Actinomycetota bacterium]|nr:MAG: hypothetical protein CM15mP49_07520 [Actinomycetota bacterium]